MSRIHVAGAASLLVAGWGPLTAVIAAGMTLGFFLWYGLLVPLHNATLSELGLPLSVVAGGAAVVWAWIAYSRYFARRAGIKFDRALQYDALTWVPFVLLWFTFVLPITVTQGSRLGAVCVTLFILAKILIAARFNQTIRDVFVDFVVTRFAIILIAELAAVTIGQRPGTHVQESSSLLLNVWGRWDAVHYLNIATIGYHGTDMAFFPLYPLLIRILGNLIGNHLVAGIIISTSAFFFGLLYLYKLVEHEFGDRTVARHAIFYVSIFPTAVFFSAVYTESLFFMLTVASFYYMREHRWLLAGIIGLLAAMTRVEGVLLVVPFVIEWYTAYRGDLKRGLVNLLPAALIPCGLGVYMAYLWVLNGDPLYFSHVQIHWNRHFAAPWTAVINTFHKIAHASSSVTVAQQSLELVFTALMIGVLIAGWRQLRPSYVAYMALSILVPMSTSSLMSMPRFALVLFPMFAILALWGRRPSVNNVIVALSLPLLGLFTVLFADWYWVA
ncbi:MAG: mannosyltransferase family protein [Vulcanimicrobiaceae bacterium]